MRDNSSPWQRKILAAIRRQRMLAPGDRVAVAVSGGADSVALLELLVDLREELGIRLMVLHCNHGLRGAEADADEQFVADLASRLELEFLVVSENIRERAARERRNLEDVARRWRLSVFRALVREGRADKVALGHTADDQAETVLLRLLRGSGTRGLAGIYPVVDGILIRPLLDFRRGELRAFLTARGQHWREDRTNLDTSLLRNRIRHELLPVLEKFSPTVVERLAGLAARSRAEEAFWAELIQPVLRNHLRREAGGVVISAEVFLAPGLAPGLALRGEARTAVGRRLVRRILEEIKGDLARLTAKHVEAVLAFAARPRSGHRLVLPGHVVVERSFDRLIFTRRANTSSRPPADYSYTVRVPGVVAVPEVERRFCFNLVDWKPLRRRYNGTRPALDRSRIGAELVVRNWRAGDSYRPLGSRRSKKVKELFQAGKIPLAERRSWPVVLSGEEIVWVRGLPVAADRSVSENTRDAIVIEEKPI